MPIGASACPMAAFNGFYESHEPPPSGDARSIVPAHRHGHQKCQQSGHIVHLRFFYCRPGSRRGDTEPVVAQWQRPVASGVAMDMLHQAMPHLPLQLLRTAIEMACDVLLSIIVAKDHVMVHLTNAELLY